MTGYTGDAGARAGYDTFSLSMTPRRYDTMTPINASLDSGLATLLEDMVIPLEPMQGMTCEVRVPAGYASDGYSFPILLTSILGNPFSYPVRPAVVHDWLCDQAKSRGQRMLADATFYCLLEREARIPRWRRVTFILGVRLWAIFFWRPKCQKHQNPDGPQQADVSE